jgi:cyclohexyl-isocyanide hydratase
MDRRHFSISALVAALAAARGGHAHAHASEQPAQVTATASQDPHAMMMSQYPDLIGGDELTIGMLVYPGMFLLDLVGPLAVFESLLNRKIHLLWKDTQTVGGGNPNSQTLIPVTPTTRFADCPKQLDVLFVPGGAMGTLQLMEDPQVLGFLASQGKRSRYITSVCTGSLILGAAGLLKGYQATSHWMTLDALKELGATPVKQRVVVDRNRITGGGVTAGIDFALSLVALLRNQPYAQAVQLYLEYDPQPPFDAGSPAKAPPKVKQFLIDMLGSISDASVATAKRIRKKTS